MGKQNKIIAKAFIIICLTILSQQKQIFIDCSDGEQVIIEQLFDDAQEGFYADIKILVQKFANNQVYVHQSVFEKYSKKLEQGKQIFKNKKNWKSLQTIISTFNGLTNAHINFRRYNQSSEKLYMHASRNNENLDLLKINKFSNLIGKGNLNRILGIINFNPHKSVIIVPFNNYTYEKIEFKEFKFHKITVFKNNGQKFQAIILDHLFEPLVQPTIVSIQKSKQNKKEQPTKEHEQKHQIVGPNISEFKLFTQQLFALTQKKISAIKNQLNSQIQVLETKLNSSLNILNSLNSSVGSALKIKQAEFKDQKQNLVTFNNSLLLCFIAVLIIFLGILLKFLFDQTKKRLLPYTQCNTQEMPSNQKTMYGIQSK